MVSWPSNCFFLVITLRKKWHTCQLDLILAYMQADIKMDLYMEGGRSKYALKLLKNLYGQSKQVKSGINISQQNSLHVDLHRVLSMNVFLF